MSELLIPLEHALVLRDRGALLVDARSPGEFASATIPGAINVPILDDDQRAEIGTLYKQAGRQAARRRGVEIVAPKIPALIEQVAAAREAGSPPAVVFCWRGGMRSRALSQFLELAGIPARQMAGGHKAFRSHVRAFLEHGRWGRLLVLRGLTGVGKTRLLQCLADAGYPVVDLEGLAKHRGSAFGHLGLSAQPTQRMFEALLWDALRQVAPSGYALTEGESRHIGRLILPQRVYQALQQEVSLWVEAPLARRVANILAEYPARDSLREDFARPIMALKGRLGQQTVEELLGLLSAGAWEDLVQQLMLKYYDPLYRHTLPVRRLEVPVDDDETGLAHLKSAIRQVLATPCCAEPYGNEGP